MLAGSSAIFEPATTSRVCVTMECTVKLFGPLAQAAQCHELKLQLDGSDATLADLRTRLAAQAPALAPYLPSCRFAVNHRYAADTDPVHPHDEIALIGLVSGG